MWCNKSYEYIMCNLIILIIQIRIIFVFAFIYPKRTYGVQTNYNVQDFYSNKVNWTEDFC